MMDLFEVLRAMFDGGYSRVTGKDKSRNAFMVNRLWAIRHPQQASLLNRSPQADPSAVVDFWAGKSNGRFPGWLYTKAEKRESAKRTPGLDKAAVDLWMQINQVGEREFAEARSMDPDALKSELKRLSKMMEE